MISDARPEECYLPPSCLPFFSLSFFFFYREVFDNFCHVVERDVTKWISCYSAKYCAKRTFVIRLTNTKILHEICQVSICWVFAFSQSLLSALTLLTSPCRPCIEWRWNEVQPPVWRVVWTRYWRSGRVQRRGGSGAGTAQQQWTWVPTYAYLLTWWSSGQAWCTWILSEAPGQEVVRSIPTAGRLMFFLYVEGTQTWARLLCTRVPPLVGQFLTRASGFGDWETTPYDSTWKYLFNTQLGPYV